jgi:hypothetical protein
MLPQMSALGQKQTCAVQNEMSALPQKETDIADIVCRGEGQSTSLCPVRSNVDLLRYCEGIVHIDAEIPDSALYLGATEQKLNRSQIPGAAVNQRCLGPPQ